MFLLNCCDGKFRYPWLNNSPLLDKNTFKRYEKLLLVSLLAHYEISYNVPSGTNKNMYEISNVSECSDDILNKTICMISPKCSFGKLSQFQISVDTINLSSSEHIIKTILEHVFDIPEKFSTE